MRHPPEGAEGAGAVSCATPGKVPTSVRMRTEAAVQVNREFVFMFVVPLKSCYIASRLPEVNDCKQNAWCRTVWPRITRAGAFRPVSLVAGGWRLESALIDRRVRMMGNNNNRNRGLSDKTSGVFVKARLAFRAGFPAAMNPEPLAGMLADHLFEHCMKASSILGGVAGYLKWRMKFEDVLAFGFRPYGKAGNDRGAGTGGDFREGDVGASGSSKEVDNDAFLQGRVLIDENPNGFVLMQGAEDGAGTVPFDDQVVAGKPAAIFDQAVDAGIVERTDHDVHRLGHERVGEGAKFPVAEVGGGEEDASAGLFGFEIVFQAFVTDPLVYVFAVDLGKACEHPDEAREGAEDFAGDGAALG